MNLVLQRRDLVVMDGDVSSLGTLVLLPPGKKNRQKFVVGDDTGTVACSEVNKKGIVQPVFKFENSLDGPVSSISLGGSARKKDKVFVSQGHRILGINKKGSEFFRLTSALTEGIHNIVVEDTNIWTGCEYIYTLYTDGNDAAFYMSQDRIHDVAIAKVTREAEYDAVLACQDKCLRVIRGSEMAMQVQIDSPASCVKLYDNPNTSKSVTRCLPQDMVYCTTTAEVGMVNIDGTNHESTRSWTIPAPPTAMTRINSADVKDISADGVPDVIVGRDDGCVQVYTFDVDEAEPQLAFEQQVGESVRSVACGAVVSADYQEVVAVGYSGRIVSFTNEPLDKKSSSDTYGRGVATVENENRIRALRKELDVMREEVERERAKFERNADAKMTPSNAVQVNAHFTLNPSEGAYSVSVELPVPIQMILVNSSVRLELLQENSSDTIVSVTDQDRNTCADAELSAASSAAAAAAGRKSGGADPSRMASQRRSALLATYRCQDPSRRLSMSWRTTEGEYGDVRLTVVTDHAPRGGEIVRFHVSPLSLHESVHELTEEELARAKNSLTITGTFSASVMRDWLAACLPDVPPRLQEDDVTLSFRNVYTGSTLVCHYSRGRAQLQSESVSSIAILKEVILREATARRIEINDTVEVSEDSIACMLHLLHPKLERLVRVARRVELIDAVKEVTMQEQSTEWLSQEYAEILEEADALREELRNRPSALVYLSGVVSDLYVDFHKLRGDDVLDRIPQLQQAIANYTFDSLLSFFSDR